MMKALELIKTFSLDPEAIERLGNVFDGVWSIVAPDYAPHEVEDARLRLGRILLALPPEIPVPRLEETALTLMRALR